VKLTSFITGIISLILVVFGVTGCQPVFQPGTLTDDLGRQVTIEAPPQRIVSHVPGITEILFALGLGERVAGVSDFCNYPEEAKLKEKVGGYFDPSVEKIVALEPDLVLTDGYVDYLMVQLEQLGIPYLVLQPQDIDGILKNIELVGRATGVEKKAAEVVADLEVRMNNVTQKVKDASRPRVFYTFATTDLSNPWTAGPGSFADSLITMAGGQNIGAKANASWVQFSIEELVNSDPEVIIVDASHGTAVTPLEELKAQPAWREITAIKENRIYRIDGDLVNRSGPRIIQGLEEMARMIHPELFK
jgi:iron complex transport system substrate-binding protein